MWAEKNINKQLRLHLSWSLLDMDQQQAALVEKYQESQLQKISNKNNQVDDDEYISESEDDLLDLLEEDQDGILSKYRDARIQELTKELHRIDDNVAEANDDELGNIIDVHDEKSVMEIVTNNDIVIVHFYQPNFEKCNIMNQRLCHIAEKHLQLKVVKILAVNAPFLATRLNVKVLPFVVIYKKGKELDRLVGFEKLGNDKNTFTIEALEQHLLLIKVINRRTINFGSIRSKQHVLDEDDDLDI